MNFKRLRIIGMVSLVSMLGIASVVQAGKIVSIPTPSNTDTLGFGGWNQINVDVQILDIDGSIIDGGISGTEDYDPSDGSYHEDYFSFDSYIYDTDFAAATSTPMGVLHGKDFPVGEPSGIKVINDDNAVKDPKPTNCIVTTSYVDPNFLGTASPEQTICSSGFQTHKRFKVNMLEPSLDGAVDLVFNVEFEGGTTRDYQVFQKMNNYTESRLDGFEVQVGTGVGSEFIPSNGTTANYLENGPGAAKLSISAPLKTIDSVNGIWDPDELATFSHGLFGPLDSHFPENGFFDDRPAGFWVDPVQLPGFFDTLTSGDAMPSNYALVPPGGPEEQFGPWLHEDWAPLGIFFDDDGDPATDATLMAFWGDIDGDDHYHWMRGNEENFVIVDSVSFSEWASDPLYFVDVIEDMLNLGLNYVVTVGLVDSTWPTWNDADDTATFTIRMIPKEYTGDIGKPGYVDTPPSGSDLLQPADEGTVSVSPSPTFNAGQSLTITVSDGNTDEGTISVTVTNLSTSEEETTLVFSEISEDRGIYLAELLTSNDPADNTPNDGTMFVQPGEVLEITYHDDDPVIDVTVETTADDSAFYVIPIPSGGAAVIVL